MKSEIVSLCADSYVSKTANETITGTKTFKSPIKILDSNSDINGESYSFVGLDTKYGGNFIFIGTTSIRSIIRGETITFQNTLGDNAVTIANNWDLKAETLSITNGTSSQFLKADGSVDSN